MRAGGNRFGQLIRDARKRRGWNQDELAEESNVGRRTISRWENGDVTDPEARQVMAVADVLGITRTEAFRALGWIPAEERDVLNPPQRLVDAIRAIAELDAQADVRLQGILDLLNRFEDTPVMTAGTTAAAEQAP